MCDCLQWNTTNWVNSFSLFFSWERMKCWSIIMPETNCMWHICQVSLYIYMQPYIKGMTGTLEKVTGVWQSPCQATLESETLSNKHFIFCWPWNTEPRECGKSINVSTTFFFFSLFINFSVVYIFNILKTYTFVFINNPDKHSR